MSSIPSTVPPRLRTLYTFLCFWMTPDEALQGTRTFYSLIDDIIDQHPETDWVSESALEFFLPSFLEIFVNEPPLHPQRMGHLRQPLEQFRGLIRRLAHGEKPPTLAQINAHLHRVEVKLRPFLGEPAPSVPVILDYKKKLGNLMNLSPTRASSQTFLSPPPSPSLRSSSAGTVQRALERLRHQQRRQLLRQVLYETALDQSTIPISQLESALETILEKNPNASTERLIQQFLRLYPHDARRRHQQIVWF